MSNNADGGGEDEESITQPLLPLSLRRSGSNATSQLAIVGSNLCPIESLDYELRFGHPAYLSSMFRTAEDSPCNCGYESGLSSAERAEDKSLQLGL